jgi:hypothetical protein
MVQPSPAREPFVEFLRALQQQRYGEQALAYLDQIAERPDLPVELKVTLDLERSKSLRIAAGEALDAKQREARLAEAKRLADKFFAEHPNHPAAASALLNEPDEAFLRGQQAIALVRAARDDKTADAARIEAKAALGEAARLFDRSTQLLKERLDAQRKAAEAAQDDPPNEIEMAWVESRSKRALCDYLLAQAYADPKDEKRKKLLESAGASLDAVYQEYRGKANVALLAHLWHGKALEELGQAASALDAYDEVLVAAPTGDLADPEMAPLFGQAEVFRLQLWAQEADPKLVMQEGDEWLAEYKAWQQSPQYQGVAVETARARLKAAEASRVQAEKVKLNRDAIAALAAIAKIDSEYRNDAILLRREAIGKMGTGGATTFEETLALGDEAAAERNWPTATTLYRQAGELAKKSKDTKKFETSQTKLAQALEREALVQYSAGDMEKVLALCSEIVRDHAALPVAQDASSIAISAALQLFAQAQGDAKAAARARLERVADYAIKQYGDKSAGDDARMTLAQASLIEGDMEGALKRLAEVSSESKRYPSALQIRGQVRWKQYLDLKRSPQAEEKAAELKALRDEAVQQLDMAAGRMRAGWQSSSEPMPQSLLETQLLLAETHLEAGETKEAAELLAPLVEALKARQPAALELTGQRLLIGAVRANLGIDNIDAASAAALYLVSLSPDEPQPNSIVVDLAKLTSQEIAKREAPADAAQASPLAAVADPKLMALRELLAKLLEATEGRKALSVGQLIFLGDASMNSGRTDRAREIYQQVLASIDTDDKAKAAAGAASMTRIRARLVSLLRNEGKLNEAFEQVNTLIKNHPNALEPLMEKGYILQSLAERDGRRWDECVAHWTDIRLRLERTKPRPPEYYDALYNTALCLVRQSKVTGNKDKAMDARRVLSAPLTLSPKLNGPETVARFQALLKTATELSGAPPAKQ